MKNTSFLFIGFLLIATSIFAQRDLSQVTDEANSFAFDLLRTSYQDDSNGLLSPFSISVALAMTYEGARGKTAREMSKAIKLNKKRSKHHTEYMHLLDYFNNLENSFLSTANTLMAQEDYTFVEKYFNAMEEYGAKVQYANFKDDFQREAARKTLNNWVMSETNDKIENLIKSDHLDRLTRLVLVNAIHFKADWLIAFPIKRTRQMIFYSTPKQSVVPYMHSREKYNYSEDSLCQIIEIAYKDSIASMIVFLPKDNSKLNDLVEEVFTYQYYTNSLKHMNNKQVDILMPKFTYESEYQLKEPLKELGMIKAFEHGANFKGISGNKMLMIDDVVHKTFIEVDETGTEAAGATAVIIREKSAPAEKLIFFNANRPFFYVIRENNTGTILFMGTILEPKKL